MTPNSLKDGRIQRRICVATSGHINGAGDSLLDARVAAAVIRHICQTRDIAVDPPLITPALIFEYWKDVEGKLDLDYKLISKESVNEYI